MSPVVTENTLFSLHIVLKDKRGIIQVGKLGGVNMPVFEMPLSELKTYQG